MYSGKKFVNKEYFDYIFQFDELNDYLEHFLHIYALFTETFYVTTK